MDKQNLIKISEMAALHGVSRQALILYDKNGLFKPVKVEGSGYRYYSAEQIPRLRLICLLKEIGVPLAQIKEYLDAPTTAGVCDLLAHRRVAIERERDRLNDQLHAIDQLDHHFASVATKEKNTDLPQVVWIDERKVAFSPFPSDRMNSRQLHMTLMQAWCQLLDAGVIPSGGFGALLDARAAFSETPLADAGSVIVLPDETSTDEMEVRTLPAGEYVCMYKYGMPYDVEPLRRLLDWMEKRGLRAKGPVVDCCLLDSLYHDERRHADFCRLEVLLG
ncbi:MAG: MerR family transcriptional regulator [Atopobiaceae bacterium]|nr:MerR family transcriptional regulator [Atopobiaceae bacterium]